MLKINKKNKIFIYSFVLSYILIGISIFALINYCIPRLNSLEKYFLHGSNDVWGHHYFNQSLIYQNEAFIFGGSICLYGFEDDKSLTSYTKKNTLSLCSYRRTFSDDLKLLSLIPGESSVFLVLNDFRFKNKLINENEIKTKGMAIKKYFYLDQDDDSRYILGNPKSFIEKTELQVAQRISDSVKMQWTYFLRNGEFKRTAFERRRNTRIPFKKKKEIRLFDFKNNFQRNVELFSLFIRKAKEKRISFKIIHLPIRSDVYPLEKQSFHKRIINFYSKHDLEYYEISEIKDEDFLSPQHLNKVGREKLARELISLGAFD